MSAGLIEHIDTAFYARGVRERIAAAIVAGDDAEIGRLIRAETSKALADWHELNTPADPLADERLAAAFRDIFAASEVRAKRRDDDREQWAEATADMRAHEAGE